MISIIIPTYNGQKTIKSLLDQVIKIDDKIQKEIIIIDSSSSDNTVKIAKNYTHKVFIIPKNKFNHGLTRNHAVSLTSRKSKYIFLTTQDTLLTSKAIFQDYLSSFKKHPDSVVAFGPHLPHPNTPLFEASEVHCLFNKIQKYYQNPTNQRCWEKYFISHNNAMYKKSFLLKHPFDKSSFGEDLKMGIFIENHKYEKVFVKNASVFHSHSYSLINYIKREKTDLKHRGKLHIPLQSNLSCKLKYIWNSNANYFEKSIQTFRGIIRYVCKLFIIFL